MPSRYSRRRFLALGSSGWFSAISGYSKSLFSSPKLAHYIEVFNISNETHNIYIRVKNDAGEILFHSLFRLKPEHGEEDTKPFLDTPTTIQVTIDANPPQIYEWPKMDCEDRGIRSAGGLRITVGRNNKVYRDGQCDTVTVS